MEFRSLTDAWRAGTLSRRAFLERATALGVGAAAAAILEGPTPRPAAAQTTQKRELVIAQGGDISKLDPHFSTSSNDIRVTFNVFDNLTNRHPDGKLQPGLATEWKATAADVVDLQAPTGRQVPQRRPVHLGRRQVLDRADVRPQREDDGGQRLHDDQPHRDA